MQVAPSVSHVFCLVVVSSPIFVNKKRIDCVAACIDLTTDVVSHQHFISNEFIPPVVLPETFQNLSLVKLLHVSEETVKHQNNSPHGNGNIVWQHRCLLTLLDAAIS